MLFPISRTAAGGPTVRPATVGAPGGLDDARASPAQRGAGGGARMASLWGVAVFFLRRTDDAGGATLRAAPRTGGAAAGRSGRLQAAGFLTALPYLTAVVALHPPRSLLEWPRVALALGGCSRHAAALMHLTATGGLDDPVRSP